MPLKIFIVTPVNVLFVFYLLLSGCKERNPTVESVYHYVRPQYDLVEIKSTADSLYLPLTEDSYNQIKSFNVFYQEDTAYISLYDRRAKTINIWNLPSKTLVSRIPMKKFFGKHKLYYTTVYVKNFDSIFINNKTTFYLFDSSGVMKDTVDFLKEPYGAWSVVANNMPPIVKGNLLYVGVQPYAESTSFRSIKKWKMMYTFDLKNKKALLYYDYPRLYLEGLYGSHFLKYSYCYNDRGNFVFSFPADTLIYETNLGDYHVSYLGKSRLQHGAIQPVKKEDLMKDKAFENYLLRDSYSYIYFDPYTKRYLRLARSRISKTDYAAKKWDKAQRIIIFDENFKIIGESPLDSSIALANLFFTKDGGIYARTRMEDEYAIHFVRLAYQENKNKQLELVKNGKK